MNPISFQFTPGSYPQAAITAIETQRHHTSLNLPQPKVFEEIPQICISDFSWCRTATYGKCRIADTLYREFICLALR